MGENRQVYRDRRRFIRCYPLYHCATRLLNELAYTLILNESPRAQYKHQPRSRATPHRGPHERTAHLHHGKAAPKGKGPVSAASTRASSDEETNQTMRASKFRCRDGAPAWKYSLLLCARRSECPFPWPRPPGSSLSEYCASIGGQPN